MRQGKPTSAERERERDHQYLQAVVGQPATLTKESSWENHLVLSLPPLEVASSLSLSMTVGGEIGSGATREGGRSGSHSNVPSTAVFLATLYLAEIFTFLILLAAGEGEGERGESGHSCHGGIMTPNLEELSSF